MAKKKTQEPPFTIVTAYRRLNEIMENYSNRVTDTFQTMLELDTLTHQCKNAGLPLQLNISEEDLNETGINPTIEASYQSSYEPEPSTESSY